MAGEKPWSARGLRIEVHIAQEDPRATKSANNGSQGAFDHLAFNRTGNARNAAADLSSDCATVSGAVISERPNHPYFIYINQFLPVFAGFQLESVY